MPFFQVRTPPGWWPAEPRDYGYFERLVVECVPEATKEDVFRGALRTVDVLDVREFAELITAEPRKSWKAHFAGLACAIAATRTVTSMPAEALSRSLRLRLFTPDRYASYIEPIGPMVADDLQAVLSFELPGALNVFAREADLLRLGAPRRELAVLALDNAFGDESPELIEEPAGDITISMLVGGPTLASRVLRIDRMVEVPPPGLLVAMPTQNVICFVDFDAGTSSGAFSILERLMQRYSNDKPDRGSSSLYHWRDRRLVRVTMEGDG